MLLNLQIPNRRPRRPTRCCIKKGGQPESRTTANAISNKRGSNRIKAPSAAKKSNNRFIGQCFIENKDINYLTNSSLQQRLSVDVWRTLVKIHWNWKSIGPIFRTKANVSTKKAPCMTSNRSEEHTSELQSRPHLVCRLLLE